MKYVAAFVLSGLLLIVTGVSVAAAEEPLFKVGTIAAEVATRHVLALSENREVTANVPREVRLAVPAAGLTVACTAATGKGEIYNKEVENTTTKIKYIVGFVDQLKLKLEQCAVPGMAGCFVNGAIGGAGVVEVETLSGKLGYLPTASEVLLHLAPKNAKNAFATVNITECALEGSYPIKRGLIGEVVRLEKLAPELLVEYATAAGVQARTELENPLIGTIEKDELKFGPKPAAAEGTVELQLKAKAPGEGVGVFR